MQSWGSMYRPQAQPQGLNLGVGQRTYLKFEPAFPSIFHTTFQYHSIAHPNPSIPIFTTALPSPPPPAAAVAATRCHRCSSQNTFSAAACRFTSPRSAYSSWHFCSCTPSLGASRASVNHVSAQRGGQQRRQQLRTPLACRVLPRRRLRFGNVCCSIRK